MNRLTRRLFIKNAVAAAAIFPGSLDVGSHLSTLDWEDASANPPKLDGSWILDKSVREKMATDFGGNFYRRPAAVLKPRSIQDVVKILRFAREQGLKVAMRGQGHSQYGQALAGDGIVIDSSTLNDVRLGEVVADAGAGATWGEVTRTTLARGLTPPAMGDTMTLSVGGILSAGGISNRSHLFGAVADNVESLEVVTGAGQLLQCSAAHNRELFELALAGMGQCALILNARLRLVKAPLYVVRRDLLYDDLHTFLADLVQLAITAKADHLGAYVSMDQQQRFRINVGKFCFSAEESDLSSIIAGLNFSSQTASVRTTYPEYLEREAARNTAVYAKRKLTPSQLLFVTIFVPASRAEEFLGGIMDSPHEIAGVWRFSLYIHPTRRFTRPQLVLPKEEVVMSAWIFREVHTGDEAARAVALDGLQSLLKRMGSVGGKVYPPYAPFFSRDDWKSHYGPTQWARLMAGKKTFDPANTLTPGMGTI